MRPGAPFLLLVAPCGLTSAAFARDGKRRQHPFHGEREGRGPAVILRSRRHARCSVFRSPEGPGLEDYTVKHHIGWMLGVAFALCACGGPESAGFAQSQGAGSGARSEQPTSAWSCTRNGTRVSCQTARANPEKAQMAYGCQADEAGDKCPDSRSVWSTAGLDELLAQDGFASDFAAMPWACLVTGNSEVDCMRDMEEVDLQKHVPGSPGNGGPSGTTPSGSSGDGTGTSGGPTAPTRPIPPTSCAAPDWEPYFAQLATYEYQRAGVNITFPVSLFDLNLLQLGTSAVAGASSAKSAPGLVSCAEGEIGMRAQSWLDAVMRGCLLLSPAILLMCQEGADYAPDSGACNATATW
jgi:hypothetical protein